MTREEAILQMNLLDHQFYVFLNSANETSAIGGIAGYLGAKSGLTNSYVGENNTQVTVRNAIIGGLVGYAVSTAKISDSYFTGKLNNLTNVANGSLVG